MRAQFQNDEANRLKKQVSSLMSYQLCHSSDHTADMCTNMNQVRVAERCVNEDVFYTKDVYRNPSGSTQPRNIGYTPWENYNRGQCGVASNQNQLHQSSQPYRHPGYQVPEQQLQQDGDLKNMTRDLGL